MMRQVFSGMDGEFANNVHTSATTSSVSKHECFFLVVHFTAASCQHYCTILCLFFVCILFVTVIVFTFVYY